MEAKLIRLLLGLLWAWASLVVAVLICVVEMPPLALSQRRKPAPLDRCWTWLKTKKNQWKQRPNFLDSAPGDNPRQSPAVARSEDPQNSEEDERRECREYVLGCFPDMCPEYLEKIAVEHRWITTDLIYYLLDEQERGHTYPKRSRSLKRKLPDPEEDAAEEARKKFVAEDPRRAGKGPHYSRSYAKAA